MQYMAWRFDPSKVFLEGLMTTQHNTTQHTKYKCTGVTEAEVDIRE